LGETLLEKGSPPDPFPKPFIAFSAQGVCDTLSRKSSRVQKKEFERKRSQENTHGCLTGIPQHMRIYRDLHNTALLLYRYHKVKARSGTKAAACSNRYATDKRAAAAANTDLCT
ncbi:MAG: hypothetical protein K6F27_03810, partial [Ruminococcus sp.]|nr:hypothetical protein [Ruminococcus sp.]